MIMETPYKKTPNKNNLRKRTKICVRIVNFQLIFPYPFKKKIRSQKIEAWLFVAWIFYGSILNRYKWGGDQFSKNTNWDNVENVKIGAQEFSYIIELSSFFPTD